MYVLPPSSGSISVGRSSTKLAFMVTRGYTPKAAEAQLRDALVRKQNKLKHFTHAFRPVGGRGRCIVGVA